MAKRQYLYENVYYDLKQKIQSGDLKAGEKLESESDMIARYGVSAITLKKALNLLVEEGLIYRVKGLRQKKNITLYYISRKFSGI